MKRQPIRVVALLCVVALVTVAALELRPRLHDARTQDQNGDGRPDIWRYFDSRGLLTEVAIDSNFDGRPDVEEFYERGILVHRESDRNFNGTVDLVEYFDARTQAQTRSVEDVDNDGTADVLVLFRDGQPVFSERASARPRTAARGLLPPAGSAADLSPLSDPFSSDLALRTVRIAPDSDAGVGLSSSGGLPLARASAIGVPAGRSRLVAGDRDHALLTFVPHSSPRAPPASRS